MTRNQREQFAAKVAPVPAAPAADEVIVNDEASLIAATTLLLDVKNSIKDAEKKRDKIMDKIQTFVESHPGLLKDGIYEQPRFTITWVNGSPEVVLRKDAKEDDVMASMMLNGNLRKCVKHSIHAKSVDENWHEMESLFHEVGIERIERKERLNIRPR